MEIVSPWNTRNMTKLIWAAPLSVTGYLHRFVLRYVEVTYKSIGQLSSFHALSISALLKSYTYPTITAAQANKVILVVE